MNVFTASRRRDPPTRNNASLVAQIGDQVTALSRQTAGPASETEMSRLLDDLAEATANLASAPSISPEDVQTKLTVLCARLRENLHLGDTGELLSYLLAEAVREDCRILLADDASHKTRIRR